MAEPLTSEELTQRRTELSFSLLDYRNYTVQTLLETEHILFPVQRLNNFSPKELILLLRAGKLTDKITGATSCTRVVMEN